MGQEAAGGGRSTGDGSAQILSSSAAASCPSFSLTGADPRRLFTGWEVYGMVKGFKFPSQSSPFTTTTPARNSLPFWCGCTGRGGG